MKVLLIEDESAAARRLTKMLQEIAPEVEVIDCLDSIEHSLNWLVDNPAPDLILMDIHLADGSSFEIFQHVEVKSPVIFITAFDQYALQAFKVNAVDYLLKPIKREELEEALVRIQRWKKMEGINYERLAQTMQQGSWNKRFLIRLGQNFRVIELKETAYFYTENKITFLIARTGKRYPLDYSLEKLEEMLPDDQYFRINRQFIIGIEAIQEMYSVSKSRVKLRLNPPCDLDTIVSTERSPVFKKWLTGHE
ncbi:MAG: response regulator transcription factor [Saprospirales bacterium]|nr:response regulator transcription factor [Saprospirales bacterium]